MSSVGDFPRAKPLKSAMFLLQGLKSGVSENDGGYLRKWEQERSRKADLSFTVDYSQKVCHLVLNERKHLGSFSASTKTAYFYFSDITRVVVHSGGVLEFDLQGAGLRNVDALTSGALETCTLVKVSYHTREKCGVHARYLSQVLGPAAVVSQREEEDELVNDLVSLSISLPGVKKIPFSSLVFDQPKQILGEGYFGYVVKAKYCGEDVAVKFLKEKRADGLDKKRFLREVSMLCNARHPHVVLCFGASVDSSKMCIVTEFVKHDEAGNCANLRSWARTAYLDAGTITRVAKDIAKTMLFLHEQTPSILHRDLRPSNVLINKHNQPILVDFGLSCIFDTVGKSKKRNQQQLQDEDSFYEATAPEVIAGEPFSQKSDVWSFGLVLLELVLKRPPQHLRPDLLTSLIPEHCNQVHKSIISSCLRVDPDGRPSFGKIVDLLSLPEAGGAAVAGLDGGSPRGPTVANAHFPSSSSSVAAPLPLSSSFVASPADQDMMSPGSSSEAEMGSGTQTPCITLFAPSQMFPSSSTTMSSSSPSSGGPRYGKLSDFRYPGGSSSAGGFSGNGVSNAEMASASASGSAYGVGAGNPPLLFGQTRPQQQQQPQVLLIPPQQQIQHQQQQQQQNEKMSEDNESQKDSNAMSTSTYSVVDMEIQSTEDVKIITYPTN